MEFSARIRLEVRVTPADVGKRVSVRQLDEDAPKGEKFTDTVGVLTSWDKGVLLITRRSGERVRIPEASLVAGKVVPSAPARRRGPSAVYEELARVAARAWQPVERARLGDWELRAAAGFTRRANSVLPLGDPGRPLDAALSVVGDWYAARDLPAYIQTATGAEGTQELLCSELEGQGWMCEVSAEMWIGALAPIGDLPDPTRPVVLSRTADEAWLGRYQRKGVSDVALKVLGSGPSVWFATVPGAGPGRPAAVGRCVVDGRWAGFAAVEVDPSLRRQGLATAVMAALARQALAEGASAAWLQVETDNAAARALYAGLGFTAHHAYHHYRGPAAPDGTADGRLPAQLGGEDNVSTEERSSTVDSVTRAVETAAAPSSDSRPPAQGDTRSGKGPGHQDNGHPDIGTGTGTGTA